MQNIMRYSTYVLFKKEINILYYEKGYLLIILRSLLKENNLSFSVMLSRFYVNNRIFSVTRCLDTYLIVNNLYNSEMDITKTAS